MGSSGFRFHTVTGLVSVLGPTTQIFVYCSFLICKMNFVLILYVAFRGDTESKRVSLLGDNVD